MNSHKVVITGMGVVSAIGSSASKFWEALLSGESGVDQFTLPDTTEYVTGIGAQVKDLESNPSITRKQALRTSRIAQMSLWAAQQALEDAHLNAAEQAKPVGVFVGCSQGGFVESENFFKLYFEENRTSPWAILKPMNSAPATYLSIECKLRGPCMTIDTACSSTNHAIGMAMNMIRSGQLDVAVVGGTDTVFSPAVYKNWRAMHVLSKSNAAPQRACKPFSRNRDGIVLGEGAGMFVIESEASALRRGAPIQAELRGYGASSDAFHITQPHCEGQTQAMRGALNDAGLAPDQINYICAHATGTTLSDATETRSIKAVFGAHAHRTAISAIKPMVGHTLAASGAMQLASCIGAVQLGWVPPTLNYEEPDPDCDLDYVSEGARQVDVTHCLTNSFAFGGSNAVLVVSRYSQN